MTNFRGGCLMDSVTREVDTIVGMASWEPRFELGMERVLELWSPKRVLIYYMAEYANRTAAARERVKDRCARLPEVGFEEHEVRFGTPNETWRTLEKHMGPSAKIKERVLVDLTTMPRDVIWSSLFWLEAAAVEVHYVYNRPETYASDWLARDPNDPRLVFKLAGTLEIDRPTALVAVTGFDENRCRQAVDFYEPLRVVLAAQHGAQYGNYERNVGRTYGTGSMAIERIEVDAYSEDHGYRELSSHVEMLTRDYNVVLCSFGPKPSAIALYRLQREFSPTALSYIGCKEYNTEYSQGLGESVTGTIVWSTGRSES